MTLTMEKAQHLAKPCTRCGQEIPGYVMEQRNRRNSDRKTCSDCSATARRQERHGDLICIPWVGEIDLDTMTPVDNKGLPYMPGIRTCGRNDCVNSSHVFGSEQAIAEQFSIFYRTGKKLNYNQLRKAVKREAVQR